MRQLYRFVIVLALFAICGSGVVRAQASGTRAAQTAVEAWLSLIDSQHYAESWDTAATAFRNAIPSEKWQALVQTARAPFGALTSRVVKTATPTKSLPGVPDGDYVVFQFTTSYAQKAGAIETVTAVRESDGSWRVGGYFIN